MSNESIGEIQASLKEFRSVLRDLTVEVASIRGAGSERAGEVVRFQEPSPVSARVPVGPAPSVAALDEQVDALREQVDAMSKLLASLRKSIADGAIPASFPSLDLLRRFLAEQNWSQLQQIIEARAAGDEAFAFLMARVRWMSQEDVLRNYGRPTSIHKSGYWSYVGSPPNPSVRVHFYFIQDYVIRILVIG